MRLSKRPSGCSGTAICPMFPIVNCRRLPSKSCAPQRTAATIRWTHSARRQACCFPTSSSPHFRRSSRATGVFSTARSRLRHAANYLYMLSGELPSNERVRALETYLNTIVDHGLNASTFTARVITSTGSDLVSAIVGAVGALKGPLHGGAPGPALDMVFEIGDASRAEAVLRKKIEAGERL